MVQKTLNSAGRVGYPRRHQQLNVGVGAAVNPLDAFRLDDKVVVITGASSGLGAGFARAVSGVGATVVLAARRTDRLNEVEDELRGAGCVTLSRRTDVSSPDDCKALVQRAVEEFGRIDVLVNNAGIADSVPATRETEEGFRRVIDVNLNGAFWMAQASIGAMPKGSAIVNVASVLGLVASRYPQAAYSASKAGVIGLTRDLAQQWSLRRGVRVNALVPGFFRSEMTENAVGLEEMLAEHSMLGRSGTQAEIDAAMLFLASPASSYVTGSALVVDGGLTAL
ncbi:MAG: NAD(P)-dependent dehydrogenase (short-subunit alcohol dehydrogenase family) [Rhodococcus sp. (in: high G+C Gram-positive bacteria)]|jgi:NAD(P)-dependent dehydrogenase (short-subunit alcohol dehydrogenase family)